MRSAILRISMGLLLLSFVACSEEKPKPKVDMPEKSEEMKQPPKPPPLPKGPPKEE